MIFDIYIPSLNIIVEYHGFQHYFDHYLFGGAKSHKDRDKERSKSCTSHGISYIEVPYWWKRDKESIVAVLHSLRPDVISDNSMPNPFTYEPRQKKTRINLSFVEYQSISI